MPVYTRTVANATFGYNWKSNSYSTHTTVNPLQFNIVKFAIYRCQFRQRIDTSSYLAFSYKDIFIVGGNYTYIFNNQNIKKSRDYWYVKFNEVKVLAGNLLALGYRVARANETEGPTMFLDSHLHSISGDVDIRYNRTLNEGTEYSLPAIPGYGTSILNAQGQSRLRNSFWRRGPNGIRAWQVGRSDPGPYQRVRLSFTTQTADIKIEAQHQYRFKLFWIMEGAVFLDAGNIWTVYSDEDRPGSSLNSAGSTRRLAVGTGFGLRFDLNFVTLRTDMGIKIRDHQAPRRTTWIPGTRPMTWRNDFTLKNFEYRIPVLIKAGIRYAAGGLVRFNKGLIRFNKV
ncbi:MAG: BamA/TamA family outer membrane protein [Bacteroidales bacterium]